MEDKAAVMPPASRVCARRRSADRLWRRLVNGQDAPALLIFLALAAFFSLRSHAFLSNQNLSNLARNLSWLAIVALGQSMVIISGGIDLSVGATLALAGLIAAWCMQLGLPVPLAIVAGMLTGLGMGWINGLAVARVRLPAYVVTLGTMCIARGIAYGLTRGWSVTAMPEAFLFLGQHDLSFGSWLVPLPLLLTLGVALMISVLLNRTVLGRYIYALSSGERALLASGVNVVRLKELVYTLCGLLAATAGLLYSSRIGVAAPAAAIGSEVDVIAAAVIGGTSVFGGVGGTLGVLLGAAVTQVLYSGLVFLGLPGYWQTISIGAMILAAILLDYWRRRRG
jgi:ribose transport system permease protein